MAAFGRARVQAMTTGVIQAFRFQPGTGQYSVMTPGRRLRRSRFRCQRRRLGNGRLNRTQFRAVVRFNLGIRRRFRSEFLRSKLT